jgi:hypothetical protein
MLGNDRRLRAALCYYDLEQHLFERITKRFARRHKLSAFDFLPSSRGRRVAQLQQYESGSIKPDVLQAN